jgi:hypothetical protein
MMTRYLRGYLGCCALVFAGCLLACSVEDPPPKQIDAAVDMAPRDSAADQPNAKDLDAPEPSAECEMLLDCASVVDAASLATLQAKYGKQSDCWKTAARSATCTAECTTATEQYKQQFPLEAACGGCDPAKDPSCSIVGTPCKKDNECETGKCLTYLDFVPVNALDGYCTQDCRTVTTTDAGVADAGPDALAAMRCPAGSACGGLAGQGGFYVPKPFCFRLCANDKGCRKGYVCRHLLLDVRGTLGERACIPEKQ